MVSCFHGAVFHTDFFMCYKGDVPNDRSWVGRSSLTGEQKQTGTFGCGFGRLSSRTSEVSESQ